MNDVPMPPSRGRDPRRKTQNHAEIADARTTLVKKLMDDERKAVVAKTAKLRAERLARDEEERLKATAETIASPPRTRRVRTKPAN